MGGNLEMRLFCCLVFLGVLLFVNLFMWCAPLQSSGGDDMSDMPQVDVPSSPQEVGGFFAWITERDQVQDAHLLSNVWVRVWPSKAKWPGVDVDIYVGEHKEVNVRCDIVFGSVSMPSRYPDMYQSRSNYAREQARGQEAIEFLRNLLFAGSGDLYLSDVRADGVGRFVADVFLLTPTGERRSLIDLLVEAGHAAHGSVDWGYRLVREE